MFEGCKPSEGCRPCFTADPNHDTVKFDPSRIQQTPSMAALPAEDERKRRDEEEKKKEAERKAEQLRKENERKAEEARKEAARKEAERKAEEDRKEVERKAEEARKENERKAEQARLDAEFQAEQVRKEAQRKADEAARKAEEEKENQEEVDKFCKENNFAGVNAKRKKGFGSKYALHSAVKKNDAIMVGRLLRCNADPTLSNSSGQTPYQLAEKTNGTGVDMSAVIAALPAP